MSAVTDGMGLNITVMSYCGQLYFGIVADRKMMPDVWSLIGWLEEELAALAPGQSAPASNKPARTTKTRKPAASGSR